MVLCYCLAGFSPLSWLTAKAGIRVGPWGVFHWETGDDSFFFCHAVGTRGIFEKWRGKEGLQLESG